MASANICGFGACKKSRVDRSTELSYGMPRGTSQEYDIYTAAQLRAVSYEDFDREPSAVQSSVNTGSEVTVFLPEASAVHSCVVWKHNSSPWHPQRKSLNEILEGIEPKDPLMPRDLSGAYKLKQKEQDMQLFGLDTMAYDLAIEGARGDHEHVDEDMKKKYNHEHVDEIMKKKYNAPRQCACDVQERMWQWLRVGF